MGKYSFECEYCGRDCGYTCEEGMVHLGDIGGWEEQETWEDKDNIIDELREELKKKEIEIKSPLLEAYKNQIKEANEVILAVDKIYEAHGSPSPWQVTKYIERWGLFK